MTENEKKREQKLADLCDTLGQTFVKSGKESGLPASDGILALLNTTAQAVVEVGSQHEHPTDFVGWATHTFLRSLKYYAAQGNIDIGLIIEKVEGDDDDGNDGNDSGGGYLN